MLVMTRNVVQIKILVDWVRETVIQIISALEIRFVVITIVDLGFRQTRIVAIKWILVGNVMLMLLLCTINLLKYIKHLMNHDSDFIIL